jgi:hypothetical protein
MQLTSRQRLKLKASPEIGSAPHFVSASAGNKNEDVKMECDVNKDVKGVDILGQCGLESALRNNAWCYILPEGSICFIFLTR